jgi:hypothetical protein
MGGACGTYGREERCIQEFGGKPEGKNVLERPRSRLEDNIIASERHRMGFWLGWPGSG